jgi:hypothetical protein
VACLRVTGNVALVKLRIDAGPTAPSHVDVRITDNGPSGNTVELNTTSASGCDFTTSRYEDAGLSGELTVIDAQPASR